jgi:small subunit ribosomal protein S20
VANHPSAEKRNRQRMKRTTRNRAVKSAVRTQVKEVREALAAKDPKAAQEALALAVKALDKAAGKGVLARKAASRKVSRMAHQLHVLLKSPPASKAASKASVAEAPAAQTGAAGDSPAAPNATEAKPKRTRAAKTTKASK